MRPVRKLRYLLSVLFAVSVVLTLVACGSQPTAGRLPATKRAEEPKYAPDFALEDLQGNLVRLSDTSGQVRLIDFWATWCAPCREEVPMFKELHEHYGDKGFTMVAVSMDLEGASVVKPFVEEYQIPYMNLLGDEQAAEAFGGILGLPTAFLVDREGRIVHQYLGAKPRKVLEKRIRELLGLEPAA